MTSPATERPAHNRRTAYTKTAIRRTFFELLEEKDNLKYYTAVGDILNHKDMLSLLKDTMVHFTNKFIELRKEYDELDKED